MPPSTGVLSAFSTDESPLGSSWTQVAPGGSFGKPNASGGVVQFPSGYKDFAWTATFDADQEVYYTVPALTTGRFLEVFLRITNANSSSLTGYNVEINTSTGGWSLQRVVNNAYATLATGSQALSAGCKIWGKAQGTTLTYTYIAPGGAETAVITFDDSAGAVNATGASQIGGGLESAGAALTIDDFGGGATTAGGPVYDGFIWFDGLWQPADRVVRVGGAWV